MAIAAAVVLGTVALPASAAARADSGEVSARSLAFVRLLECSRGPQAENRVATFRGTMRRVRRARGMSMRFRLQERVGDGRFSTVNAPGLGVWRKSLPGVRRFAHRQRIVGLAEGSAYRAVVSFRWHDRAGHVIHRVRRRSRACDQPGALANLSVLRIAGGGPVTGRPPVASYRVHVANRGQATAPRFGVSFAVDGGVVDIQTVASLAPGERRELLFTGPPCQRALTARVDPQDAVRESSEKDNVVTTPCLPGRSMLS